MAAATVAISRTLYNSADRSIICGLPVSLVGAGPSHRASGGPDNQHKLAHLNHWQARPNPLKTVLHSSAVVCKLLAITGREPITTGWYWLFEEREGEPRRVAPLSCV